MDELKRYTVIRGGVGWGWLKSCCLLKLCHTNRGSINEYIDALMNYVVMPKNNFANCQCSSVVVKCLDERYRAFIETVITVLRETNRVSSPVCLAP